MYSASLFLIRQSLLQWNYDDSTHAVWYSIQVPCLLPFDPLHQYNPPLSPSIFNKLPPNILPRPLQLSTPSLSNESQMLPPSNVTTPLPPYNDPLPLPTMPITFLPIPPPASSPMFPLMSSSPHTTRHLMTESIGLEAQQFPPSLVCAQSICRQWPSKATVACLSCGYRDVIVHAACGQLAIEYLCKSLPSHRIGLPLY